MHNGDIPVYTTGDAGSALPTEANKATSDVYGDNRYANNIGGWKSYPGLKKFLDNKYDPNYPTHDISYRDFIVMRLSEMYLIKAECEIYAGGDPLATINVLRDVRAISGKNKKRTGAVTIDTILEERAIELKIAGHELSFKGMEYLVGFALPNFYFHIVTAYNILRHNGVEIGKRDYMGA